MSKPLSLIASLASYLFAFLLGAAGVYYLLYLSFLAPVDEGNAEVISFEVKKGWNLKNISRALEDKELLRNWYSMYILGLYFRRDKLLPDGKTLVIHPGEYHLSRSLSPEQILDKFISGEVVYHEVTIPEGMTLNEIAQILSTTPLTTLDEAQSVIARKDLFAKFQVPGASLEGYIFPETYRFTRPETAVDMITRMLVEGQKRITKEMYERAIKLGLSMHQVLTLASVIEKETGDPSERKTISSVFHNRMRIGMPLQSDPTVIYGVPNFDGNLTREHLNTPSPYNTYLNPGLPPTPICSPGTASVEAALYPEDTDFLYFVAKGDGTHHFSPTYKEHKKAVNKYQRGK